MVLNLQGSCSTAQLHRFIDSRGAVLFSARSGSQNSAAFQISSTTRNIALRHNHHAQAQSLSIMQTPFLTAKHLLTSCLRRKLHCTFQNSFPKMHNMSNSQKRLITGRVIYSVNTSKIKHNSFDYSFPFTLVISHMLMSIANLLAGKIIHTELNKENAVQDSRLCL